MKIKNRILVTILIILVGVSQFGIKSMAASGSTSIGLSAGTVQVGQQFTVTVNLNYDTAIGGYTSALTYDPSVIEFVSSSSANGGGGNVTLSTVGDGVATSISINMTFKAVSNGTSAISVGATSDAYTFTDETQVSVAGSSTSITVAAPVQASTNNNLASLQISPGSISPAFATGTTNYNASVGEDVSSVVVSAVPADSTAKVSVSGNQSLKAGNNKISVVVTAQSGAKKTYVITVNKAGTVSDDENTTTEESNEDDASIVNIDGKEYTFLDNAEGMPGLVDFTETTAKYKNLEVLAFESPNKKYKVVCLLDLTGGYHWYMIDEENSKLTPYIEFNSINNRYIFLALPGDVVIPEGYSKSEYSIDGNKVEALVDSKQEYVILYGMNVYGEAAYYKYDVAEGTFQRYTQDIVEVQVKEEDDNKTTVLDSAQFTKMKMIIYTISGICIILFVILMVVIITNKVKNKAIEKDDSNN